MLCFLFVAALVIFALGVYFGLIFPSKVTKTTLPAAHYYYKEGQGSLKDVKTFIYKVLFEVRTLNINPKNLTTAGIYPDNHTLLKNPNEVRFSFGVVIQDKEFEKLSKRFSDSDFKYKRLPSVCAFRKDVVVRGQISYWLAYFYYKDLMKAVFMSDAQVKKTASINYHARIEGKDVWSIVFPVGENSEKFRFSSLPEPKLKFE